MSTCLGLYIEDRVIKYAKVSKDNDVIKIDSFGIKFFEKLNDAIKQVIEETYSYKTPISINLSNESYHYFYLFSMLKKKDMQNVVNTEFESICYDNGLNKDAFETRYVLVNDLQDKEKVKAIHVSANKADIAKKEQQLDGYRIIAESPIGTSIGNLLDLKQKENVLVVNIENKTTVTTIIDSKIVDIQTIDEGAAEILSSINAKENSYSKAYEVCKNSTIYTQDAKDLQYEENEYLDDIMPPLYNIVTGVRKITEQSLNKIEKVYITGTASVINNIDIYFQEYLKDIKCEILKPYFINNAQTKINIKDYIEVNSAIAVALDGLGDGIKGLNFKKENFGDKLSELLTMEIGGKKGSSTKKLNLNLNTNFGDALTSSEKSLIHVSVGIIALIIVYIGISMFLGSAMTKKQEEIAKANEDVTMQIESTKKDISKLNEYKGNYEEWTANLENLTSDVQDRNKRKNSIPTLLNQIMFTIPKGVQITSIENTSTDIVIKAQASTYEQLGYLVSKLKGDGILVDVTTDSGQKQGQTGLVTTNIKGKLPIE